MMTDEPQCDRDASVSGDENSTMVGAVAEKVKV